MVARELSLAMLSVLGSAAGMIALACAGFFLMGTFPPIPSSERAVNANVAIAWLVLAVVVFQFRP